MKRFISFLLLIGILCICWVRWESFEEQSFIHSKTSNVLSKYQSDQQKVYGFIDVEGTKIHYPIAQHPSDDSYYLSHDIDDNESIYGAVFTEKVNSKDFNDFATIVYGHATNDGSMFGTLSNFADKHFFSENRVVTVQTKKVQITYDIFAAYSFNDDHLLYTFNIDNPDKVSAYLKEVKSFSEDLGGNYREPPVSPKRKLLILSTCDLGNTERRFVVHALERERKSLER